MQSLERLGIPGSGLQLTATRAAVIDVSGAPHAVTGSAGASHAVAGSAGASHTVAGAANDAFDDALPAFVAELAHA